MPVKPPISRLKDQQEGWRKAAIRQKKFVAAQIDLIKTKATYHHRCASFCYCGKKPSLVDGQAAEIAKLNDRNQALRKKYNMFKDAIKTAIVDDQNRKR